jgi:hypothetical protein
MRHLRGVLGLLVLVLGTVVAAPPAGAQTVPPPSLAPTERLLAGPDTGEGGLFTANFDCAASSSGDVTIAYTATGVAVGAYPGTFMESGSVTFHPDALSGTGPVTALLDVVFTISAVDGTLITGTKTVLIRSPNTSEAFCATFGGGQAFDVSFASPVSYEATIKLPDGSMFFDSGTGTVTGHRAQAFGGGGLLLLQVAPPGADAQSFVESFDATNGVVPLASSGHVTGGGFILGPTITDQVSFGFEAKANPTGLHATCTVIDHATKSQIKCKTIDSLVVVGTHAYFTGLATVSGPVTMSSTTTRYRIDVDDLGEPGTLDTFKIQLFDTVPPYTAAGILLGGNIQIHKQ